jgi:IS5 family transposase
MHIDTTVQQKDLTFPTDSKIYRKVIAQRRNIARRVGIGLRQSCIRKEKALMLKMRFYRHPKRKKETREQRHLETAGNTSNLDFFPTAQAILSQIRQQP